MKGNIISIGILVLVLLVFIIAAINAPRRYDWSPNLQNKDKNPFGAYIVYNKLREILPASTIRPVREPLYNVLHTADELNSAYILFEPEFSPGQPDLEELLSFVHKGNTAFIAALDFGQQFMDTLGIHYQRFAFVLTDDSTTVNFVNPALKADHFYGFKKNTIDGYFRIDDTTGRVAILGITSDSMPDFLRIQYGEGNVYLHAAPLCFSNYFMLYHNNADYTAKALSYIPADTETVFWDEYYKSGREGETSPLRFFLGNTYLKWALYLSVAAMLLYVLFEMKRRQRIIPDTPPLRNTTLDFVETVAAVYYSSRDNNSIAAKKIQYWFDFIRRHYYLSTNNTGENFIQQLQRKSGVPEQEIRNILHLVNRAQVQPKVTDDLLVQLCKAIDDFYTLSKK